MMCQLFLISFDVKLMISTSTQINLSSTSSRHMPLQMLWLISILYADFSLLGISQHVGVINPRWKSITFMSSGNYFTSHKPALLWELISHWPLYVSFWTKMLHMRHIVKQIIVFSSLVCELISHWPLYVSFWKMMLHMRHTVKQIIAFSSCGLILCVCRFLMVLNNSKCLCLRRCSNNMM